MSETTEKNLKRIVICQPTHADVTMGSSRGFWRATKGEHAAIPLSTWMISHSGSLLAQLFNGAWCVALNEVMEGRRVDYFAMLHADVEPEDWWADILVEELEAKKLDVLSAVVPIKDHSGLTSTAFTLDPSDPWHQVRLTMREIHRLPVTFTADDVGGRPLLLNTGCWVCKFNPDWAKQVRFTINDRITFDEKAKMYRAEVEPEDWNFSRQCNALGLKIGATRKVRLDHAGRSHYVNFEPWGSMPWDIQAPIEKTLIPDNSRDFNFPEDVEGWLGYSEGKPLADLARGKTVLEIGSYCGRSTICLAQTADHLVAIDPHDGRQTDYLRDTWDTFLTNVRRYGVAGRIAAFRGVLLDYLAQQSPVSQFDLIFIDGDHRYEAVLSDIAHALPLLKADGLMAFHDYRQVPDQFDRRWDGGVTRAVNEFVGKGAEIVSIHSTLAIVKPPAVTTPLLETAHA